MVAFPPAAMPTRRNSEKPSSDVAKDTLHSDTSKTLGTSNFTHTDKRELLGVFSPAQVRTLFDKVARTESRGDPALVELKLPNNVDVIVRPHSEKQQKFGVYWFPPSGKTQTLLFSGGKVFLMGERVISLIPENKEVLSANEMELKEQNLKFISTLRVSLERATHERLDLERKLLSPTVRLDAVRHLLAQKPPANDPQCDEPLAISFLVGTRGEIQKAAHSDLPFVAFSQKRDGVIHRYRFQVDGKFLDHGEFDKRTWKFIRSSNNLQDELAADEIIRKAGSQNN